MDTRLETWRLRTPPTKPTVTKSFPRNPALCAARVPLARTPWLAAKFWNSQDQDSNGFDECFLVSRVLGLMAAGVSHDSPRAQTCTFEGSGLHKHQQNSTKRTNKREGEQNKIVVGEGKKERHFGRPGGGGSGGGGSSGRVVQRGRVHWKGVCRQWGAEFGFRVQFKFFGTKTETEQKQNEERDE